MDIIDGLVTAQTLDCLNSLTAVDIAYHRYGLKLLGSKGGNARSDRRVLEGFLIRVDGGYGCVQPWPELGDGTLEEQWQALRAGGKTRLLDRALECAVVDAAARRGRRSLFDGLAVPRSHATLPGDADFAALQAEGFTTVKLKGGRDWREVLERMRRAIAAGLRVRVDFNGVLDADGFLDFTKAAEQLRGWVDFVEDPVPYAAAEWERLGVETGWRLALDWIGHGVAVAGGYDVRVIKPGAGAMPNQAELRASVVVTSYMDHPLGQAFAAWEAGRFGGRQELAGLLTHRIFEQDAFTARLAAVGPEWMGPGGTGLGFDDLLEALPWVSFRSGSAHRAGRVLQNPRDPLPGGGPVLHAGEIGFATSGSTGMPSVVIHTGETLAASSRAVNQWLAVTAADVWLRVLPEFHVGGYQIAVRAGLSGSRVVVDDGNWSPDRFFRICQEENVTLSSLVPAQVVDLVRSARRAPSGLRVVVVGGGALESRFLQQGWQLGWPLLPSYGATEAGSQVATSRLSDLRPAIVRAGLWVCGGDDEAGTPSELLDNWEARTVTEAGENGAGLLELRGPALATERFCWKDDRWILVDLTDSDGWWRTTDRVIMSGRQIQFVGRADRVVKVLGELVNLEAVERALDDAGLVAGTFAVVGFPEERRGMELVLVMERPGEATTVNGQEASEAVLLGEDSAEPGTEFFRSALDAYTAKAVPFARLGRVFMVERLPRSALGKVRLAAVASLIPPRAVP